MPKVNRKARKAIKKGLRSQNPEVRAKERRARFDEFFRNLAKKFKRKRKFRF